METNNDARFLGDKESLEALIDQLEPITRALYRSYGSRSMEAGFPNRKLIIYTLRNGSPEDVETLTLGAMAMGERDGPVIKVTGDALDADVGLIPVKWGYREVFLHIPQEFVFKWKGKVSGSRGVNFVPHYAVLIKTRSREHLQVDGHTYVATLNNFRERFPKVPIRY